MVAFFILASSFFVAAEFALVSVRETRIQQLIALGHEVSLIALFDTWGKGYPTFLPCSSA